MNEPVRLRASRLALALLAAATGAASTAGAADAPADARLAAYRAARERVFAAPPEVIERIGRHIVVGIDDTSEIRRLVAAKAVAGVFVTPRNLRSRTAKGIAAEIAGLQALRRATGLADLWIAADQEGGLVQKLSPPLPRQAPLARVVAAHAVPAERKAAVEDYARRQGRALAGLGVTVNFAPVADLDRGVVSRGDAYSRISRRALAKQPSEVAEAAHWYCAGLRQEGVTCTLKHFPGLGRVAADTHTSEATLATPLAALRTSDWVPFRVPPGDTARHWTMLGHARIAGLDPDTPASASKAAVDVLRNELGVDGVLVTDDFSMGAITRSRLGPGGAAVAALNAGVDLVLVSFDPRLIVLVLDALIQADMEGRLDRAQLELSAERLARARRAATAIAEAARAAAAAGVAPLSPGDGSKVRATQLP